MTDDTGARGGLAEQMQRLQSYVADAHARGEAVPPQADAMLAKLHELMGALDELTGSMEKDSE